jgi:ABC-type sugar transport system substrate-binding protein
MDARWKSLAVVVVVVVASVAGRRVQAGDVSSDLTKAGKSIAKAAKKFGREVAEGSKEIGTSVADATEEGVKTAWFKTRNWTTHESKRVADATVRFWDDVIRGKETTRDRLHRENESLKAKAAETSR